MALEASLDRLQRWMQAVIVHPGAVEEAVMSPGAEGEIAAGRIPEVILPSASLTPTERIGIYHGMYLLRMEEALSSDYPALKKFLGSDGFFELVRAYVQVHPSRCYTFNQLGDHLPAFIASASWVKRRGFCHDLARLELAVSQVFDAPESHALSEEAIAAVPHEAWEHARLVPIEAFRLLSLRYPASAHIDSLRSDDHDRPPTARKDTWVAVYRRNYSVFRHDLSRSAHALLADLVSGMTLGEALAAALERRSRPRADANMLQRWFQQWVSGGIFRAVALKGSVVGLEGLEPSTNRL